MKSNSTHHPLKNTVEVPPFPITGEAGRTLNLILFGFHCHSDIDIRTLQAYVCLYNRTVDVTGAETCGKDRRQNAILRQPPVLCADVAI